MNAVAPLVLWVGFDSAVEVCCGITWQLCQLANDWRITYTGNTRGGILFVRHSLHHLFIPFHFPITARPSPGFTHRAHHSFLHHLGPAPRCTIAWHHRLYVIQPIGSIGLEFRVTRHQRRESPLAVASLARLRTRRLTPTFFFREDGLRKIVTDRVSELVLANVGHCRRERVSKVVIQVGQ